MVGDNDKAIKKLIVEDLAFYDTPFNEVKVRLFAEELKALEPLQIKRAQQHFRNEKGRTRAPMPADIKAFLGATELDDDTVARDLATRVVNSVTRYGWPNGRDAEAALGELGWLVVQRHGGWRSFCDGMKDSLKPMLTAQIRDEIKALMQLSRAGRLHQPVSLPESKGPGQRDIRALASSIVKEID